jgi:hypothetical protein
MPLRSRQVLGVACWAALCAGAAERPKMDDTIQRQVAQAALAEHGWKPDEVRVDAVEGLGRQGCAVYTVAHTVKPLSYQGVYAVLPGGRLVGRKDPLALEAVLDACGAGAPAIWWAEVVTWFHPRLGAGVALRDEQHKPSVTRKLAARGQPFTAPALGSEGGTQVLRFLLLEPEANLVFEVRATRAPGGPVELTQTQVL